MWNPYYTQLADPLNQELYRAECGPNNPLRCYVGDLSGRLGTIDVGEKRQVFSDSNIPLGTYLTATISLETYFFKAAVSGHTFYCPHYDVSS